MAERAGSEAYEQKQFIESFLKRRHRNDSPNRTIETPAVLKLIGDPSGIHVLDIGCGDGSLGSFLLAKGCASYLGIEGSEQMAAKAEERLAGTSGMVERVFMEEYSYPMESFDLVVSQLAIHYCADIDSLFSSIIRTLKPGGRLVFSIQHPLLTSSYKRAEAGTKRSDWIVDDYFKTGKRVENWMGEQVVKYHRTASDYYEALTKAGFKIERFLEPKPDPSLFENQQEYERRLRIPLFLLFACRKEGKENE
ncbi:methyltransferase domain-containing protein [Bacillus mangrovi]|uniref:Methyltransferase domain-containing protein n=1 Tax=Metabacillus mangrovi TaxID=1491830 RepID=A0A7X2S3Z5_9BACI|nr:class I SAM-dependent methyltransferase [Metabacillus mangrovi]MTH53222.1 methyltransferase domain-containing protein [Metabacillus mangrovi]